MSDSALQTLETACHKELPFPGDCPGGHGLQVVVVVVLVVVVVVVVVLVVVVVVHGPQTDAHSQSTVRISPS